MNHPEPSTPVDLPPEWRSLLFPRRRNDIRVAAEQATRLSVRERARLASILGSAAPADDGDAALPAADGDRLPRLLSEPPWHRGNRRPRTPPAVPGITAHDEVALVWADGERERALAIEPGYMHWDDEDFWDRDISEDYMVRRRISADRFLLAALARRGPDAAASTVAQLRSDHHIDAGALLPIRSAAAAELAVDAFARPKTGRRHALAWLERHGADGIALVVPVAFGAEARRRRNAAAVLRHLAQRRGGAAVLEAAARYGRDVRDRIDVLLRQADPLDPVIAGAPKPGPWATPAALPPVRLRDEDAVLPPEATAHLVEALSLWTVDVPYTPVEALADVCDRGSLTEFSRALFELWLAAGEPPADTWAIHQLACFGDADTVALLEPHLRRWAPKGKRHWAMHAADAIARIGGDAAFLALYRFSRLGKYPATAGRARELADALARRLGGDAETLADRLAPDLGLRDPASLALDYGSRRFTVTVDEDLTPRLYDESGRMRKSPPKPGVRDDAASAEAARERFKWFGKDLKAAAAEQATRLERAMIDGRTWTLAALERDVLGHPVTGPVARRLVWAARTGTDWTGFRIDESGGLADVDDRHLALPADTTVRVAHPALLGDTLDAWQATAVDYAILQPFDQLNRRHYRLDDEERRTGRLTRLAGLEVAASLLRHVTWHIGDPSLSDRAIHDDGADAGLTIRVDDHAYLLADLAEPVDAPWPRLDRSHTLTDVRFAATANRHPRHARPLPGDDIDPAAASEAVCLFLHTDY